MMGWQWHQTDHMQIICTSLQTDNHASTAPLNFAGRMPSCRPTNNNNTATKANEMPSLYPAACQTNKYLVEAIVVTQN